MRRPGGQFISMAWFGLAFCTFYAGNLAAQIDLSGQWANRIHEDQPSRGPGLELGEFEGLPINNAARLKAESWNASVYTVPERQCIPFAADMGLTIGNVRIWSDVDPSSQQVVAWHIHHEWQAQEQVIWMDGRPHPPAIPGKNERHSDLWGSNFCQGAKLKATEKCRRRWSDPHSPCARAGLHASGSRCEYHCSDRR